MRILLLTNSEEETKIISEAADAQRKTLQFYTLQYLRYSKESTDKSATQYIFDFGKLFIRAETGNEQPEPCFANTLDSVIWTDDGAQYKSLHEYVVLPVLRASCGRFLPRALTLWYRESVNPRGCGETITFAEKIDVETMIGLERYRPNGLLLAQNLVHILVEFGLDAKSLSLYQVVILVPLAMVLWPINKILFRSTCTSEDLFHQLLFDLKDFSNHTWRIFARSFLHRRQPELSEEQDKIKKITEQLGMHTFLPNFIYVIEKEKELGQGMEGSVWKCNDIYANRTLAVKILKEEAAVSSVQTLGVIEEFRRIHALDHENLAKYYALDLQAETKKYNLCIFMEFCDGGTLKERARKYLSQNDVIGFTRQTVEALAYLHDRGILHLDLKGENILLTGNNTVKVCDFGMSHKLIQSKTRSSEISSTKGTTLYMAPEMVRLEPEDKAGRKCDIWSFGCLLLEMLTGRHPEFVNTEGIKLDAIGAIIYYIAKIGKPFIPKPFRDDLNQTDAFRSSIRFVLNECLQRDPDLRPTAKQLKSCGLLKGNMDEPGCFTDVAVIGIRDIGKSFLINNLRGLNSDYESAARVQQFRTGPVECHICDHKTSSSFDPVKSPHYVRFWEIHLSAMASSLDILSRCTSCIIVSNAYFSESDYEVAKEFIERNPIGMYLVHTKCAHTLQDQKLDGNLDLEDQILENLRTNIKKLLPPHLSTQAVYMIDNRDTSKFDFELFRSTLFAQLHMPPPKTEETLLKDMTFNPVKIVVVGERGSGKSCLVYYLKELIMRINIVCSLDEQSIDFSSAATSCDHPDAPVVIVCCKDLRFDDKRAFCTKLRNTGKRVFLVKTFTTEDVLQRKIKGPPELQYLSRQEIFSQVRQYFVKEMDLQDQSVYFIDNYESSLYDFDTLRNDIVLGFPPISTLLNRQQDMENIPSC